MPKTATPPPDNGMTPERFAQLLALFDRHDNDPGYFDRLNEQLAEARARIEEQENRALREWEGK
ncbi:MAG: hypothetical protein H7Y38_18285 [Armatimonadetes bacterium]|nr:hypothetical protein [Armatimonadota bacterium]